MLKRMYLLLAMVSCTLMISEQAWTDMNERLKNRVIHVETLLKRGRWLWQNDNHDQDDSKYLYIDELAERDTYYRPRAQYETTVCGKGRYLCLESLSIPNHYLTAGFPPGVPDKFTVKLQRSFYVEDNNCFHWRFMCKSDTLEKCKIVPVRFEREGYLMVADNWGSESGYGGGHYDATLGKEGASAYFRVHAPNPDDEVSIVFDSRNEGKTAHKATYSLTMGVSQTHETTESLTSSTSLEIGGAFKAFSLSVSSTISKSWATTDSTTYETAKTVEHELVLPPRTRVILEQLKGHYAGEFSVGSDKFNIREESLDDGDIRTRTIRFVPETIYRKEEL